MMRCNYVARVCLMFRLVQVDEAFVSNINRIYYWHIDNSKDFLYNGAVPQVSLSIINFV